jgi:hypothetical protein
MALLTGFAEDRPGARERTDLSGEARVPKILPITTDKGQNRCTSSSLATSSTRPQTTSTANDFAMDIIVDVPGTCAVSNQGVLFLRGSISTVGARLTLRH